MKEWIKISLILCTFGFFRELRPNEPFVTTFLSNGVWRDVTIDEVNRKIYPFGTYSYLVQLFIVFLITDFLRYKPIIIASAAVGLVLWSLLLWTKSLFWLYMVQVCYGFYMASEVAIYTYMYSKVSKDKYQRVTGYTRASLLTGKFVAGALAQMLISFELMNVRELNYISLGSQAVSFVVSIFLPTVGISLYMWKIDEPQVDGNEIENTKSLALEDGSSNKLKKFKPKFSMSRASSLLWIHFKESYSNRIVLIWSIWWSLSTAGFFLIINYIQVLWDSIDPNQDNFYNGGVEALLTLFGAISASFAGHSFKNSFEKYDLYLLTMCSLLEGIFTIVGALTENVWISYLMYILTGILFHFIITLVTAFVAKFLSDDSFALIFGINTLVALIVQTVFTVIFVSETASFKLSPRDQFMVFGYYFLGITAIYLIASLFKFFKK